MAQAPSNAPVVLKAQPQIKIQLEKLHLH